MRAILIALLVFAAGAAAADDRPKWLQEPGQVIEGPISPDDCILVEWIDTPEAREQYTLPEGQYTFPRRPMAQEVIDSAYWLRANGLIRIYSCRSSGA